MGQRLPENIAEKTVPDLLKARSDAYPNKLAVVAQSGRDFQMRLTYRQLDWLTGKLAGGLYKIGLRKSDRVALFLSNFAGAECVLTFLSTHKLGAVNVPVNTRYVGRELEYILNHCGARYLVVEKKFLPMVNEIKNNITSLDQIIEVGKGEAQIGIDFEKVLAFGTAAGKELSEVSEDDDADWLYTSGTTGLPKGVMHTHGSTVATGIAVGGALGLRPTDVYQSAFPFFTSSGCHFNLMSVLYFGATLVIDPEFQVKDTLAAMEEERATVYVGVPSVYTYILDSGLTPRFDLSSIRLMDYGGAPMPKEIIKKLYEHFPGIELRQTYGLTEAGPTGTYLPGEFALSKLGSVGKEGMPLVEVRIVDDSGQDVKAGQIGEICYRGPAIMKGYFKDSEATKKALLGGWLHSGDLVVRDEDGFIYHVDRKKDIIIRGGFNIASMEIENALYEHPAVLEAAVVAKPHEKLGEDILAYVVLKKGMSVSVQDITEFCRSRLADFKVPRNVEFIDALPRNPMGKILKTDLRQRALGKRSKQ